MRLTFALVRVAIVAVALWVATKVVPGIGISGSSTGLLIAELVGVAAIFVVVEEILKPVIKALGCLLYALTLGLIGLVVNALLLILVGCSRSASACRSSSTGSGRRSGAPSWSRSCRPCCTC
jgi:uncharacterized membrane protein YvlD (DUF360 family)